MPSSYLMRFVWIISVYVTIYVIKNIDLEPMRKAITRYIRSFTKQVTSHVLNYYEVDFIHTFDFCLNTDIHSTIYKNSNSITYLFI